MKKQLFPFWSSLTLLAFVAFLGWFIASFYVDDTAYQQLVERVTSKQEKEDTQPYTAVHPRERIRKEMVFSKGKERLQAVLEGEHSDLVLDYHDGMTEVLERITHMKGMMQDSIDDHLLGEQGAMQKIHFVEADRALYHYQEETLAAQHVRFSNFTVPGRILYEPIEQEPTIKGEAYSLVFSMGKDIVLDGNVTLEHSMGKAFADHVEIEQRSNTVIGTKGRFQDLVGEVYADHFQLDYKYIGKECVIDKIYLEGNVSIRNRFSKKEDEQQYALADIVEYFPLTKEMWMRSHGKKPVLFYDKANGYELIAPVLFIKREKGMKMPLVKAEGNVRFHFDEGELEELRHRFAFEKREKS